MVYPNGFTHTLRVEKSGEVRVFYQRLITATFQVDVTCHRPTTYSLVLSVRPEKEPFFPDRTPRLSSIGQFRALVYS